MKKFVLRHKRGPGNPNAVNHEMIKRDRQANQHERVAPKIKATSPRTTQPFWPNNPKHGLNQKRLKAKIKLAPVSILNSEEPEVGILEFEVTDYTAESIAALEAKP